MCGRGNRREDALQRKSDGFAPDMRPGASTVRETSNFGSAAKRLQVVQPPTADPDAMLWPHRGGRRLRQRESQGLPVRTNLQSIPEDERETLSRWAKQGPMLVIGAVDWAKSNEAWRNEERRRSLDGTIRCVVCGCDCDERDEGELHHLTYARLGREIHGDIVALCLTHSVMVERIFAGEPGWKNYPDRAAATRTIIKMLSGTTEHTSVFVAVP
jgi:hypothetical protein